MIKMHTSLYYIGSKKCYFWHSAKKYFCIAAKLDGVKTYMRMRRVPNHLQVKVIKWFDYLWLTQKCSDEEKAVSCLPGETRIHGVRKCMNLYISYKNVCICLK